MSVDKHTEAERKVVDAAVTMWNAFAELERTEGVSHPSHRRDVADAAHVVQRVVAMRLARRVDPETWPTKGEHDGRA
jgi:hypothetical protein